MTRGTDFGVDRELINKRFSEVCTNGQRPDTKLCFDHISMHLGEKRDTFYLIAEVQARMELRMDLLRTLVEFNNSNLFRG